MKKIATVFLLLLAVCGAAHAQSVGNCLYQPALDQPMHRPDTVLVTFSDYTSVRLTDPDLGYVFVYRTSLEQQNGANTMSSCQYLATRNNIKANGNQLCLTPREYSAPSTQSNRLPQRKGWGTGQEDAFRFAIPAGTLTAVDPAGVEHVLDSISFQYLYTEVEDTSIVEHDPFEYILTPASGEQVSGLGEFTLQFPYCPGIFTMNYDQPQNPYVLDAAGQVVTTGSRTMVIDLDFAGRITLQHRIITPGQYTLVIPAGSYHMSTSAEAWDDSICHPEIRAIYDVLGEERMAWTSVPADGQTVTTFDGIYFSFPGKTIASRATNLGGGNLKVYRKDDDKYPAMEFSYFFSKIIDNRLCFTTASQVSKVKDGATYYCDVPYGLVTFDDGTVSDAIRLEFTYDTTYDPSAVPTVADNYVGYTTGAVYRKDGVRFNSGAEQGMLIRLPKEKTALLAGRHIKAVRTATGTSQMDDPRLVIIEGDDINATPAVEQATSKFSTSMKDYALDTPYEIKGDQPLFIGIKCSLSAAYNPMLFDETLDLPDGYAWALTADGWTDISRMGYGAPNIQLLVDENVAASDLLVKPFYTGTYNKMGNPLTISTQVYNYGTEEVTDFDVTYKIGDADAVNKHIAGISLKQGENYDLIIDDVDVPAAGLLPMEVKVTSVNGGLADAEPSDNAQRSEPYIYPADVCKKILFEEFTGMNCINCPAAVIVVNEVLSQHPGEFIEVYHHAGYNPDNFTLNEDLDYTWFFNNGGSTYAPGGMVNRTAASAEASSVVFQSNELASVRNAVDAALGVPPYVGISMKNEYDNNSRTGSVTVDVNCYEVPTAESHVINVWLVQDNVVRYQKGSGVVAHNNAMRMSLTGSWGKQIQLEAGESHSYTFDYTIPASISSDYATNVFGPTSEVDDKNIVAIPRDMRIVAFVSDLTNNALSCHVWNAEECIVTDQEETGILAPTAVSSSSVYDLQGRKVESMNKGIYIIDGKKVIK